VYDGKKNDDLKMTGRAIKAVFENQFSVPVNSTFVQVGAVENNDNEVVRKSEVFESKK
jgi:hypothetical protein